VPVVAPQWRVWSYEQPALVLGCSQHALHESLLAAPGGLAVEALLRESGGGAVLAGPWLLGLSLALPGNHPWLSRGLLESYRHVGQLFADTLNDLGMPVQSLAPARISTLQAQFAARGLPALGWACFGNLSPWEVVDAQGRKIVGLAQRRRKTGGLLVAGLLIGDSPWELLCDALGQRHHAAVLRRRTAHCTSVSGGSVPGAVVAGALQHRVELILAGS
jgi:lipoate-protein ligase A